MKLGQYLTIGAIVLSLTIGLFAGWQAHSAFKPCPTITTDTLVVQDSSWYHIVDSLYSENEYLHRINDSLLKVKQIRDTLYVHVPGTPPPSQDPFPINDTDFVYNDYYSVYRYPWEKQDTNIQFKLNTTITQNKPVVYDFSYNIKRPQTIINNNIDNSVTYHKYLQLGLYTPLYTLRSDSALFNNVLNTNLKLTYVFPKGSAGIGWQPRTNTFGVEFSTTIFKFKKRK